MTVPGRHRRIHELVDQTSETPFLTAVRRFPWTFLVYIPLFVFLGLLIESAAPPTYTATTTLIVEDPRASTLFEITDLGRPSSQSSERYLADQVAIIESTVAAEIARSILDDPPSVSSILEDTTISGDAVGNVISIEAQSSTAEDAKALADALALAYQEIRRDAISSSADVALQELDGLLSAVEADLSDVNARIEEHLSADEARRELRLQFDQALATLNELRRERDAAETGSGARAELNARIDELLRDFEAWSVILDAEVDDPELAALITEQDTLVGERANLIAQRNSISVGAELSAGGVMLFAPAELPDDPTRFRTAVVAAAVGILGLVAAVSSSYWLAERRPVVDDRNLAEGVLDAPLLAEIPRLDASTYFGEYPVLSSPGSREARSFRFAASALDVRTTETDSRAVLAVGALRSPIQSAVIANIAVSQAINGYRVLLIDADSLDQRLTHHMFGQAGGDAGLVDVLAGATSLESVTGRIEIPNAPDVRVLPFGHYTTESAAVVRDQRSGRIFDSLMEEVDVVLVDLPRFLDTPYAGALARYSDSILVLLEHGTPLADFEQLVERLDLMSTPLLGYMYVHGMRAGIGPRLRSTWLALKSLLSSTGPRDQKADDSRREEVPA